ncbi:hypothetical protein JAO76_05590 [Pontibacter sp. BT310]|uniref:DUF4138 domain-containing protein n=1 Tax=Pontibacter populi TaxID=890055 RepID=A0ABS6XAH4_9BACT|nr:MULTISPECIES: hypothetical protein [Pontibacter]MBJ6117651.1 hypothetical protein [Pontibacter sp. BT310]MBR0570077.1 hypothetical protein [Microvirga sp. STS03]MBW3364503.1 hypothetical protein [Pontibacter populi]
MKYKLLMLMLLWSVAAFAQKKAITVTEQTITIPADGQQAVYFYGFQKGDVAAITIEPDKPGQTINLEVQEFASGAVVYSSQPVKRVKELKLTVPQKLVYKFIVSSTSDKAIPARLSIKRLPEKEETRHFNANITWQTITDTTWATTTEKVLVKGELTPVTIVDKTFRVASMANLNPSRVSVPFKLPANTVHWVYWIGVGQQSVEDLKNMTKLVTKGASVIASSTVSPVVGFGLGLLPGLPQVNASGNIDYYFMNKQSAEKFVADEEGWKLYPFAQGTGIVSDYKKVTLSETPKTSDGTLHATFRNSNTVTGLDITLKIVAFEQEKKYVNKQVRKPVKIEQKQVPVFGEK